MYYPNRTLCDVLEEMRACYKSRNFANILGLVEEAQGMGNRMEAKLFDQQDFDKAKEEFEDLKDEISKLQKERKEIKK